MTSYVREPKTAKELFECAEISMVDKEEITLTSQKQADLYGLKLGDTVIIPKARRAYARAMSEDSIAFAVDEKGRAWAPEYYDGMWYKREVLL